MKQVSFSHAEYAHKKKITRREKFLAEMNTLLLWNRLLAAEEPFYPKGLARRPSPNRVNSDLKLIHRSINLVMQ